ncbi:hypothetical protein CHS0354_008342 [Potamilus streckersoni]|uniref:Uncharacterized protein n=1 Tax=Potamilus streckersoni TaxID=2493646 RepID=A0AAE0SCN9_9BIVA|nr:hypothetical protein CHS0354_008342 [Potamilus streckersoni]
MHLNELYTPNAILFRLIDPGNDLNAHHWRKRWRKAGAPPHNILPSKGNVHIVANRDFVDFLVNNKTAKDFYKWTTHTEVPDETFFSSMNHNPHLRIRGQYLGPDLPDAEDYFARFKIKMRLLFAECHGKVVRDICIPGVGDLPFIKMSKKMFLNKIHWDYQSFVLDCLEELIYNTTRDEYFGLLNFDSSIYKQAVFVQKKVP